MTITLKNLYKSYNEKQVFNQLSLSIPSGKITCLMGPSGCGKTTLVNLLLGLTKPDQGTISGLDNQPIGVVFQEDRLCENLSSIKNVALVCPKSISKEVISHHLLEVSLNKEDICKPVHELSGGMKRRVALVRALIIPSSLFILDEPFKGLDQTTKYQVIDYIKKHTAHKTVLVVTHDKEDVDLLGAHLIEL